MPIYDIRANDSGLPPLPGVEPFPRFDGLPGELIDAAGARVEYAVRCDTETGEVWRYDVRDGRWQIDPGTRRVAVVREARPAPLEYRPHSAERKAARDIRRLWLLRHAASPDGEADAPLIVEPK